MNKTFTGKIIYKPDLDQKYVNGAFGSVNANGDFVINFFFEAPNNPDTFSILIDENTNAVQNFADAEGSTKIVHTQIVMTVKVAESIQAWMKTNVELFNSQAKK